MPAEREHPMTEDGMRQLWEDLWPAGGSGSWNHWEMETDQNILSPKRQRRIKSHKMSAIEVEERDGRWFLKGDPRQGNREVITRDRVCNHLIEQWSACKFGWKQFMIFYMDKFTGTTREDLRKLRPYVQAICRVSINPSTIRQRSENESVDRIGDALTLTTVARVERVTPTPIQPMDSSEQHELVIRDASTATVFRDYAFEDPTENIRDGMSGNEVYFEAQVSDGWLFRISKKRKQGCEDDQMAADPSETNAMNGPLLSPRAMHSNQRLAAPLPLGAEGDIALQLLLSGKEIIFVIGAGISEASGIPTFRSEGGIFQEYGKKIFEESTLKNEENRKRHHRAMGLLAEQCLAAQPTIFHLLLAALAKVGHLQRLYSQNIDGLDTRLKVLKTLVPLPKYPDWPITIQLHGGLQYTICTKCGGTADLVPINHKRYVNLTCTQCPEEPSGKRKGNGKGNCHYNPGQLRPGLVLYCDNDLHKPQDHNPDHDAQVNVMNYDEQHPPDLLFVVGASCTLPHIRGLIKDVGNAAKARSDGTTVVWINPEDPPKSMMQDNVFDLVVKEDCQNFALWCLNDLAERAQ